MKKYYSFLLIILVAAGCSGSGQESSPFAEILVKPPYSSITDSISREKNRDDLYFRRAVLLNRNNLPEPALADFRKAWSLNQEESYAIGIGNILLEKQPDSATVFLREAVHQLPESIFLHLLLARSYDARQQTDQAIAVCDEILRTDSNQVNTLVLKAELLEKKNDIPGMITALQKAYRLVPGNVQLGNKLAYQYAETKNPAALVLADSMIKRDSQHFHADPFYVKGLYYSNVNDKANALRLFDQAIQRDHRYQNAYIEKGKILLDQKKTADAVKTFQLAITVNPAFPDAWYWIGQCQEILGQKEDAKLSYEKAYSLDKTFTLAKEAADKLKSQN
jgi:tetratricopeptide (TPR) repeat protein